MTKLKNPSLAKFIDFNMRNVTITIDNVFFKSKYYSPEFEGAFDIELTRFEDLLEQRQKRYNQTKIKY